MGVLRFQNKALTSPMVRALDITIEEDWSRVTISEEQERLEDFMAFVLIKFWSRLREEEIPLVFIQGLLYFWDKTRMDPYPFIIVTLYRRCKGETGFRWHYMPISNYTQSGIPFWKLIGWLLVRRVEVQGMESG